MFRKIMRYVLVVIMFLLDVSILPFLTSSAIMPLFSLVGIACMGLLLGRTNGTLLGIMSGLLFDIAVSIPFGLYTILFGVTGLVTGFAGRKYQNKIWTTVMAPLICYFGYEVIMLFYSMMAGSIVDGRLLVQALIRVVIATIIAQPLYLLYDRILKPTWSKYTM